DRSYTPTIDEIFTCKLQLFELPITGKYIEDQVESLNSNQMNLVEQREHYIDLPQSANSSSTMKVLKKVLA
ncbi:unnamed protein product, partial [Rotaria magnacalcarata]